MYTYADMQAKYPKFTDFICGPLALECQYPKHDASYQHAEAILQGLNDTQIAALQAGLDAEDAEVLSTQTGVQLDAVWALERACTNAAGL